MRTPANIAARILTGRACGPRLAVLIAGLLLYANHAGAEDAPVARVVATYDDLATLVSPPASGSERGARGFVARLKPVILSFEEASAMVADNNLDVRVRAELKESASARVIQSASVFDTVFTYSTNYFRPNTFDRDAVTLRLREQVVDFERLEAEFEAIAAGQPRLDSEEVCVVVDGELINGQACADNTEFSKRKENASFDSGPFWNVSAGLNVGRQFRWGGSFDVDYASTYRYKRFHSLGLFLETLDPDDPLDSGSRRAWTSSLGLSFSMPLPFSKDFGEYGSRTNVNLKLADIDYSRTAWDKTATFNDRIGETQASYWRLVGAALRLHTTVAQRALIEQMAAKVEQRFDERLATDYDRIQAGERLQRVLEQEEAAWSDYLQASNELVQLLDFESDLLIIPHGYEERLHAEHQVDPAAALATALDERAELRSAEQALESARVAREHAAHQARPDLSLVVSWSLSQVDTAVGYTDWSGSFANLVDPDQDDFFVGVFFRRPFGNAAPRAARERAGYLRQRAQFALDQQRINIADDVNATVAALLSSEAQVKLTRATAELAQTAFERAERLRGQGVVSEFELLNAYQELLDARTAYVDALANYQQSYAGVERAQGLLAEQYNGL